MEKVIRQLISNKITRYKDDYNEMLGDYNRELETIKGYNGRQILELLQNCDDEGSKEVVIALDKENNTISISNIGTPFSEKGYRSLFIANLSSKNSKRKYIGNKGLGFRSVINWSKAIEIQSNSLALKYSEQIRKDNYNSLVPKELQAKIRTEENLAKSIIPMPFLCLPELSKTGRTKFATCVIIHYKEIYFDKIIEQVKKITPETLLFLKSIQKIKFTGFENRDDIVCEKENILNKGNHFAPKQKIKFKNNTWYIFETENDLPSELSQSDKDEKEFYQVKIAVEENFNQSAPYLYSFFPTNIQLKQPYILHATFDLDATRNQINDSDKNRYILEKIVEFTVQVAKYYTKEEVSYRPLEILNHKHSADTLANLGYYDLIQEAVKSEEVFPCVDNTYKKLEDAIYISDQFADMLIDFKATDIIDMHILPLRDKELDYFDLEDEIDQELNVLSDIVGLVNRIALLKLSPKQRSLFVSQIVKECQFIKKEFENQINFLTNINDKTILGKEYIYTPITQKNKLHTPSFTKIQFINKDLFNELLVDLAYEASESTNKGRFIYEKLKGFCNLHSYEPATLAIKIISETNNKTKEHPKDAIAFIKEMNSCLFHNYKQLDEETKKSPLNGNIPTITLNKKIKYTDEVVLSNFYPTGIKTTLIFEDIYKKENYIASPLDIGIEGGEDIDEVENYLAWINVNRFAKYNTTTKSDLSNYFNFIKEIKNITNSTGHSITFTSIDGFEDVLGKISVNRMILWVYYDEVLNKQLSDINNGDVVKNSFYSHNLVTNKPSYLKYLITDKYKTNFSVLLLDEKYTWVNDFNVDYRAKDFLDNGITKSKINEILVLLGAKDDFNKLSIEKVAAIINKLPEQYKDGKKSQAFYKKALSHYKENQQELNSSVKLFADTGSELKAFDNDAIYFSDKIKLPKKLKQHFPVFNFPSRSGGLDAIKFFNINDLKDLSITITKHLPIVAITEQFIESLDQLKPLILTHRLNVIEEESQRKIQASICKKIEIVFCSEIQYQVKGLNYEVADYESLHSSEYTFYVKINEYDTLKSLRKNFSFTESFADIISLSFDISGDKNEFKNILRNDFDEALSIIENDFGKDTLHEARELLGLADFKQAFWQAVFVSGGKSYPEQLDDLTLEKLLKAEFNIEFNLSSLDYEKIYDEFELLKIKSLFDSIHIDLKDFVSNYSYKISLEKLHFKNLTSAILSRKNTIKSSIWSKLNNAGIEDQAKFLNEINKYEHYEEFALSKAKINEHEFIINNEYIVNEYLNSLYGELILFDDLDLDLIKKRNQKRFTEDEQFEISQSERLKSLIYFVAALETIKSELQKSDTKTTDIGSNNETESASPVVHILSSENLIKKRTSTKNKRNKKVFTPKIRNNRSLKDKGNKSEQLVYDYLIHNKEFKNVYLASEDNEGLHYDIRYVNSDNQIKYVEVKTFDNNSFYLSKDEYDFGQKHKSDYEIWLVEDQRNIIPIMDFFINPKYELISNEYLVHLEVLNN